MVTNTSTQLLIIKQAALLAAGLLVARDSASRIVEQLSVQQLSCEQQNAQLKFRATASVLVADHCGGGNLVATMLRFARSVQLFEAYRQRFTSWLHLMV